MAILVTGAKGQLGSDVCRQLTRLGIENRGVDLADFDITNKAQTQAYIAAYRPQGVIHCAAYTAVDKAEGDSDLCRRINVTGTENIAVACLAVGAKMMYISTDYVFDGEGEAPFETDAPKGPTSVYGLTKAQGEEAVQKTLAKHFIVRISWVFGENGLNFIKTMLRLGQEKESLNVVCDQIGSPTYTKDLAPLLCDMIQTEKFGTYHATNEGYCSWYEFASRIMERAGLPCKVLPIATKDYPTPAKRPMNSRLSKTSLDDAGFKRLPPWEDALERYLGQGSPVLP